MNLASATVTLSLAARDRTTSIRRWAACSGSCGFGEDLGDLGVGDILGQAVGAEQQDVAIGQGTAVDFDLDTDVRSAHDIGDDVAAGMFVRVLRRDGAGVTST